MNIDVVFNDERASEVFGSGLPLNCGSHLAVDITLRCALTAQGLAAANAATTDGAALMVARTDQDRRDHEVLEGDRCQLVVVGLRVIRSARPSHTRTHALSRTKQAAAGISMLVTFSLYISVMCYCVISASS